MDEPDKEVKISYLVSHIVGDENNLAARGLRQHPLKVRGSSYDGTVVCIVNALLSHSVYRKLENRFKATRFERTRLHNTHLEVAVSVDISLA